MAIKKWMVFGIIGIAGNFVCNRLRTVGPTFFR
jgi:hypothetical protein